MMNSGMKSGRARRSVLLSCVGLAAFGLIALVSPLNEAYACRTALLTMDYKTAVKMIRATDVIFVGTVVSSSDHTTQDTNPNARFEVRSVWKGKPSKRVDLHTWVDICRVNSGKPFPKGSRYLVFATKERGDYQVIRNWVFYDAKAPAEVMRALKDHKTGS